MQNQAITISEFTDCLSALGVSRDQAGDGRDGDTGPVVACSGGPDSMALTLLADQWAIASGKRATALIVNHGLRAEAGTEAQSVSDTLKSAGIAAHVLTYSGPTPTRDIQAAARSIRYRLMSDWLAEHGRKDLFLAHHQDDQAETVMLRLARGSGVDGLSAMAPVTHRDGTRLIRPLLGFPKSRLVATLVAAGIAYVQDPSNRNNDFSRVRIRGLAQALSAEGLTPARLAATAGRMARARDALNGARDVFLRDHVSCHATGYVAFDAAALASLPEEIGLRVLSHIIRVIGAGLYPPREAHLVGLHRAVVEAALMGGRTLAGTRVLPWRGQVIICREQAAMAGPAPIQPHLVWDDRYTCRFDAGIEANTSAHLVGPVGVLSSGSLPEAAAARLAELPGAVRPTLPGLWADGEIAAVPHLGFAQISENIEGEIAFRTVSEAWGQDIRQRLPFSNR